MECNTDYQVVYILTDRTHGKFAYTVYSKSLNRMIDIPVDKMKAGAYKQIVNYTGTPDGSAMKFSGAKTVSCGNDYRYFSGRLASGFNDFQTYCLKNGLQQLLLEYDTTKNLKPVNGISSRAIDKVWWKCSKCGYEWESIIKSRTQKSISAHCPACRAREGRGHKVLPGYNDLETWCKENNRLDILAEYSPKNKLKPSEISRGNDDMDIIWKCQKCGHEYKTKVRYRIKSLGCPKCRPIGTSFVETAIYESLKQYINPIIHKYRGWNPDNPKQELDIYLPNLKLGIEYNGATWHSTDDVSFRDVQKAKACKQLGINLLTIDEVDRLGTKVEWIDSNLMVCSTSQDTLPELVKEILRFISTVYKIPIQCSLEDIKKSISSLRGSYINKVDNSVAKLYPWVAALWDVEKNGDFTPDKVTPGTKYKAWFKCPICNQSYYSFIRKQVDGQRCPTCSRGRVISGYNDLATVDPYVMKFWNFDKNIMFGIDPEQLTKNSKIDAYWKCPNCHTEVYESIENFRNNKKCDKCGLEIYP